jgi:hypothetical protein
VVTALPEVEFGAIKALPLNWRISRIGGDATEYFLANQQIGNVAQSIVAATATQMGMVAIGDSVRESHSTVSA